MNVNNLLKINDDSETDYKEQEKKTKKASIVIQLFGLIGFPIYGVLEKILGGKNNTFIVGLIIGFALIIPLIISVKKSYRLGMVLTNIIIIIGMITSQIFSVNSIEISGLMMLDLTLYMLLYLTAGFIVKSRPFIIVILGSSIINCIIIPFVSKDIDLSLARYFIVELFVLVAAGITTLYFTTFLQNIIKKAEKEAEKEKKLREQFKSSIEMSINTAQKTSDSISSLFSQVSSSTVEMITTIENINDNVKIQKDASKNNAKSLNSTINTLSDINNSIQNHLILLKDINSKMNSFIDGVKKVSKTSNDTKEGFIKLMQFTNQGQKVIKESLSAMAKIEQSSKDILNLNKEIQSISDNMGVLSINSSIEAANAGLSGKGFAVLSMEIRKLALNSSESARKSDEAVSLILQRIEDGAKSSREVASIFENIMLDVHEFNEKMSDVNKITLNHYESTTEIYKLIIESVEKLNQIATLLKEEVYRSNEILTQSNEIEKLSYHTASVIKEQVNAGKEILESVEEVNKIIEENRELTLKMNEIVTSIN